MQKHLLYIPLIALSSALALTACSDEVTNTLTPDLPIGEKTPIELSVGGVDTDVQTRAVITDGTDNLNPFSAATRLFLYMKSEDSQTDAAHTHTTKKYALTYVEAAAAASGKSPITTAPAQQLYWDDAHSRCSKLTVYAFAIANKQRGSMDIDKTSTIKFGPESGAEPKVNFRTEAINPTFDWAIGGGKTYCDQEIFEWGDVVFSNNIADYHGVSGKSDDRMDFDWETTSPTYRKFDKGDLIFYHALTKMTVKVVMGEGFTSDDFKFNTDTNIKLQGFKGSGTFDLAQGEFTSTSEKTLDYIAPKTPALTTVTDAATSEETKYYELYTYLVPGTDLKNSTQAEAMTLLVNNNKYVIPMTTLYNKILANTANQQNATTVKEAVLTGGTKMKAGVHYIFTINLGKTKIKNITAQVAEWEEVEATKDFPTNARIELLLEEREKEDVGKHIEAAADIYRALDQSPDISDTWESYKWEKGYTEETKNVYNKIDDIWKLQNDWYWPTNKHYYHFRAVMPTGQPVTAASGSIDYDYLTLTAGNPYTDVCWGAPIRDVAKNDVSDDSATPNPYKFIYDFDTENGFGATNPVLGDKSQIYQAIGPTEDQLKLILFHMMSEVKITMTSNAGADYVDLGDGTTDDQKTKVKIEGYYTAGRLQMGNAFVVPSGDKTNSTLPSIYTGESYNTTTYGVVPQDLTDVQLRITTPDHNEYVVKLTDIKATSAPTSKNMVNPYTLGSDGKYTIDKWYPGFKYHYKLVLQKKQVSILTVTILDWETLTTDEQLVQIQ